MKKYRVPKVFLFLHFIFNIQHGIFIIDCTYVYTRIAVGIYRIIVVQSTSMYKITRFVTTGSLSTPQLSLPFYLSSIATIQFSSSSESTRKYPEARETPVIVTNWKRERQFDISSAVSHSCQRGRAHFSSIPTFFCCGEKKSSSSFTTFPPRSIIPATFSFVPSAGATRQRGNIFLSFFLFPRSLLPRRHRRSQRLINGVAAREIPRYDQFRCLGAYRGSYIPR